MPTTVERIVRRLRDAETDLAQEAAAQQRHWHYRVHRGRVWFDREVARAHRRLRKTIPTFLRDADALSVLTAPVIYSLIVPLALVDFWITVFQAVCFPIYGIPRVRRRRYLVIDRHKLAYLNGIEKLNCVYCGYANGLLAYVREIAARTEQYWCPIKHGRAVTTPHARYHLFFDYGDGRAYRQDLPDLRETLRQEGTGPRRTRGPAPVSSAPTPGRAAPR